MHRNHTRVCQREAAAKTKGAQEAHNCVSACSRRKSVASTSSSLQKSDICIFVLVAQTWLLPVVRKRQSRERLLNAAKVLQMCRFVDQRLCVFPLRFL